jgi:DNA modification methylase
VLDPFAGAGTTLAEAVRLGRRAVGYEVDAQLRGEIEREVRDAGGTCRFVD